MHVKWKYVCLELNCFLLSKVIRHFAVGTCVFNQTQRTFTSVRNQCNLKNKLLILIPSQVCSRTKNLTIKLLVIYQLCVYYCITFNDREFISLLIVMCLGHRRKYACAPVLFAQLMNAGLAFFVFICMNK